MKKPKNWGQIKGGFNSKGNTKEITIPKKDEKLAEFIGIVLGDGHLHTKHNCITIFGSLDDIYYYELNVIPLIKSLFNIIPKLKRSNHRNSYYIYFYSKEIMDFLINLGMKRGNKINARIPKFIKQNKKLIPAFIKGLFDTDGYLKFSKQTRPKHYYPRIRLAFGMSKFTKDIGILIRKLKFNHSSWEEDKGRGLLYYEISGKENLEKWMTIINPHNLVHKTKYLLWKKRGYHIIKSSLKSRLKALNLNRDLSVSTLS
jgi:hypothetical protein